MSLQTIRADLVEAVEAAGYKVHAYGTPKLVPPCVVVDESDDYLSEGDLLKRSEMKVSYDLWLFVKNAQTKEATIAMDNMIENVVFNLGDWTLTGTQAHVLTEIGGTTQYVSKLSITKYTEIGGQ